MHGMLESMSEVPEENAEILDPNFLLSGYLQGIFPMADEGEILWFSPEKRGIIPLDERFHINRGLKRALKKKPFKIKFDEDFEGVMRACGEREETWIDEKIIRSYCHLNELGYAHSVECWDEEGLQGGLYGVQYKKAFFGESMFSRKTDASKIAMVHLVEKLREEGVELLDTQWITPHLKTFGGYEIPKEEYLGYLRKATLV